MALLEYEEIVKHMKDYRKRYLDYWESSAERTGSKRFLRSTKDSY